MMRKSFSFFVVILLAGASGQQDSTLTTRRLGKFQEVFAWKQLTYNINGNQLLKDRFSDDTDGLRAKRADERLIFNDDTAGEQNWGLVLKDRYSDDTDGLRAKRADERLIFNDDTAGEQNWGLVTENGNSNGQSTTQTPSVNPNDEAGRFFIQYNNLPMGVERAGDRLFITVPRRRHGIPSTLNYLSIPKDGDTRSPGLRPYPDILQARSLTSVYRTRTDQCGRLWMVDTGLLEIPGNPQQVQPPAIVIFDLVSDKQILRYPFKSSDIPAANTPTGLASITVDITDDCSKAYAYIPDLTTYGLIVYSLENNDSWRLSHNYFHFNPLSGNLNIADQSFQWNDGIFSITLTEPGPDGCRTAYFHPMASTEEFAVSTCVLKNNTISNLRNYYNLYSFVGNRGEGSQSTMHGYHQSSRTIFFADIGRDALSCWNTGTMLSPANIGLLARHRQRLSYPSDLHVTNDEVWVMANTLPKFGYATLDTNEYNFYIYSANANDLISGTVCSPSWNLPTYNK